MIIMTGEYALSLEASLCLELHAVIRTVGTNLPTMEETAKFSGQIPTLEAPQERLASIREHMI